MLPAHPSVLIISSDCELKESARVWGSGGWLEPDLREGLDWLTLARMLGWGIRIVSPSTTNLRSAMGHAYRCIILACGPDNLSAEHIDLIRSILAERSTIFVTRRAKSGSPLDALQGIDGEPAPIEGKDLRWSGSGPQVAWRCRNPLPASTLRPSSECRTLATLDGAPLVVAQPMGKGVIITLGIHPSEARDREGVATALLRQLLIYGSSEPAAWFHWNHTMVLRMDDPGGAQNVHCGPWSYPKLPETEWVRIGDDLRRREASLSAGYISGWVDDGLPDRGKLLVNGDAVSRIPGAIHPSPQVHYHDRAGHRPGTVSDYQSEYRGLRHLQDADLLSIELHGFTHIHPDRSAWLRANDRFENEDWFRELGRTAQPILATLPLTEHPLAKGSESILRHFGVRPTTIICPGEDFTDAALGIALDLGLQLVGSYYLAIRHDDRFCWSQHVCAPYLNEPDSKWFDAGLPVIGYFHDLEPALEGVAWITRSLDAWESAGARRFIDYRHFASALDKVLTLEQCAGNLRLVVSEEFSVCSRLPFEIHLANPSAPLPQSITVISPRSTFSAPLESRGSHHACLQMSD